MFGVPILKYSAFIFAETSVVIAGAVYLPACGDSGCQTKSYLEYLSDPYTGRAPGFQCPDPAGRTQGFHGSRRAPLQVGYPGRPYR